MKIYYVYDGCAPKTYRALIENRGMRVQQQSQKYNQLLMEGLVRNGVHVQAVSSRPVNRSVSSKWLFGGKREHEAGIDYYYVPFVNFPVLRNLSVFFSVLNYLLFSRDRDAERVVVCDALNIAASSAAVLAAKILRIKCVGIITDVPCHRPDSERPPKRERFNLWLMKQFDRYLLLTEQMNQLVNLKGKPYIVMEGHVDTEMVHRDNKLENKARKKICLYAGTLRRIYGIENLVLGFIAANVPDSELHIYGNGDYEKQLEELSAQYPSVKYLGVAPNEKIVEEEIRATLLINPRPTDAEYTKYSFPSKNMEYMATGTPTLTTCLPGMPEEYKKYIYLIDDESASGVGEVIRKILAKSPAELHEKGMQARKYVLEEKNNVSQAKRLLRLIRL